MQQSDRLQQLKILDKSMMAGRNKSRNFTEESPDKKMRADYETLGRHKNSPEVTVTNRREDLSLPSIKLNSESEGSHFSPKKYLNHSEVYSNKLVRPRK